MRDYFSYCFISSQIGAQKPGRQFFDHCFSILRENGFPELTPEEVIIIGDSISSDISGGIDYGMHTCLYQKNAIPEQSDSGADYVVNSLSEIKNIL
jgi:2-haloacid dehalogenase